MKRTLTAASLGLALVALLPAALAQASNINVTTTDDETVEDTDNGVCSLREAISAANKNAAVDSCTAGSPTDTDSIVLAPNTVYVLDEPGADDTNAGGDLDIFDDDAAGAMGDIDINTSSPSTIVQQVSGQRVIHIDPTSTLPGTAVDLRRLVISGGTGPGVSGAGVFNDGPLVFLDLEFVTIAGNYGGTGSSGGGILSDGGLGITGSEIHSNSAGNFEGGVFATDHMSLSKSTIAQNSAGADGAGIYYNGSGDSLGMDISTISSNSAGRHGGGIFQNAGTMQLRDSTVTNNTADTGTPNAGEGGGIHRNLGTVDLQGTILAGNFDLTGGAPDCYGNASIGPTSSGVNIIGDDTGCFYTPGNSDMVNPVGGVNLSILRVNSPTAPLTTRTHLPFPGSPALDAAEGSNCAFLNQDQRGYSRPSGAACDIGAVEAQVPPAGVAVTSPTGVFQLKKTVNVEWDQGGDETGLSQHSLTVNESKFDVNPFTHKETLFFLDTVTSTTFAGKPGFTYCFTARFRNGDQQLSPFGDETCTALPVNNTALKEVQPSMWDLKKGKGFYLNSYSQAKQKGAKLTLGGVKKATAISLVATKCPTCGKVRVSLGSDVLKTINLRADTTKKKQLLSTGNFDSARSGKVTLEVRTAGKPVKIEGLGITKKAEV